MNDLVLMAKKGDCQAKRTVVDSLKPLVIASIRRFYNKVDIYDDLIQMGRLEILQAIDDFDEEIKVPFLAYIKKRLSYFYLGMNKAKSCDFIDECSKDGVPLTEILQDDADIEGDFLRDEKYSILYRVIDELDGLERELIVLHYFKGLTLSQIAKKQGVSASCISQRKKKILETLRKSLIEVLF